MPSPNRREFIMTAGLAGTLAVGGLAAAAPGPQAEPAEGISPGSGPAPPPGETAASDVPLAPPDKQPPNLKLPEAAPRKVGWAIVGLGELSLEELLPAFAECKLSEPVALVSGHPEKAKKVAEAYGVAPDAIYDYDGFDRIRDDRRVEVVYIVLPNSMHAEYTVRALKAGKHVLCEKPMAVTVAECERMIAAAKEARRKLMIAYRLHYEPFNRKAIELCRGTAGPDSIGKIRSISASNVQNVEAPNIRLSRALGGGPVGDIGIYCLNAARYLTGEEPVEVAAVARTPADDPRFREVPAGVSFTLRFPSGVLAQCECAFDGTVSRRYRVHGADGNVDMDPAFSYRGLRLRLIQGDEKQGGTRGTEIRLREVNQFAAEMDHFSDCVLSGKEPRTPGEEGLADMRVIAAIDEALRTGRSVPVS